MEIYNEEVRDLLGKELNKSLEVKERSDIGVFVKDLSGYVVHNADDLDNIMKLGNKNRAVGSTLVNIVSSRSHAIFSITIESSVTDEEGEQHVKMGKLQLVSRNLAAPVKLVLTLDHFSGWSRRKWATKQDSSDRYSFEGGHKD